MSWIFLACIPPFLWAFNNLFDEYMGKHHFGQNGALFIFLSSLFALVPALYLFLTVDAVHQVPFVDAIYMVLLGFLVVVAFVPYIWAIQRGSSSIAVPVFQTIPVFAFILGWMLFGETASMLQLFAAAIIIGAASFIGFDFTTKRVDGRSLGLMLVSSLFLAVYMIFSKQFIDTYGWTVFAAWDWLGGSLLSLLIILTIPGWRSQSVGIISSSAGRVLSIFFLQIVLELVAVAAWFNAMAAGPTAALVQTLNGLQPAFVLILSILAGLAFHKYFPKVAMDRVLIFKFLMIGVIMVGVYLLTL